MSYCSFPDFARSVYPFLEFEPFHETYYRVLQAFAEGRIRRLVVTMPPQHGKSMGATTLLPAYLLGLDPDLRVAIASYSASLASKFNRRAQRILDSREYAELFPDTTIKQGARPQGYIRTSDEVEIIDHKGSLLSVGREGSLTGNRVDCFILDDLYKDAMEANSPLVRTNCWEWYTSVVRTRMHNQSRELIVFTRWHEEDLIGELMRRESFVTLIHWAQLDAVEEDTWLHLNFEALKASPPTELDPRREGEALWESQQGVKLLTAKRKLDPLQFEAMYQGHPTAREGLLYGTNFGEYDHLPHEIVRYGSYTDTADMGDDYLCSLAYAVDVDGLIYITDCVYTRESMELTESMVAEMLRRSGTRQARIESNNGGRGFARAVQRMVPEVAVEWFHQSGNKEARILSNAPTVLHLLRFPQGWNHLWPELYQHLTTYRRTFRANRWHDAADVVTGIVEKEVTDRTKSKLRSVRFL
ncbi:MAG: phage terminase large subunit [Alistipes sp.]|nr:phage terminase large subunit [Alistipes sp.]